MELTTNLVLKAQEFGSRTYCVRGDKIEGFVDEIEALKQTIYKILATEKYEYPI